jgi:outer membrane lipoprotein-sorting protein
MKNLKSIMCIVSVLAVLVSILLGCAYGQTAPDNYLKMKGNVLNGKTADISVFQEDGLEWTQVRTMKSRKSYLIKLDPEQNYYVIFESPDGLRKVMYVDGGSTGMWVMQLDIDFSKTSIKYARMYQEKEDYSFKVVHKDKQKIIIGSANDEVNPLSSSMN